MQLAASEKGLKHQPFAYEAVKNRQASNCAAANQAANPDYRYPALQSSQVLDVQRMGAVMDRSCAQKEKALEERVIERVQ